MIDKLVLKNYQAHKWSVLEFCPALNVIVGASDKGKTSLLRALDWVINNRPGGDAFRRRGTKETAVAIVVDDFDVTRSKGKTNAYGIYGEVTLTGFGQSVPEKISRLLNMGAINIQRQFDGPFLLNESSGEVARRLNEIADLQIIDTTIAKNNKNLKDVTLKIASCDLLIGESKVQVSNFAFLDGLGKELDRLVGLEEKQRTANSASLLLGIVVGKIQHQQEQPDYEWVVDADAGISALDRQMNIFLGVHSAVISLDEFASQIEEIRRGIEYDSALLKAERPLQQLERLTARQTEVKKQAAALEDFLNEIDNLDEVMGRLLEEEIDLETEWWTPMPDECPLCGAMKGKRK